LKATLLLALSENLLSTSWNTGTFPARDKDAEITDLV